MRRLTSLLRASALLATVMVVGAGVQLSQATTAIAAPPPAASAPTATPPAPGPLASPFVSVPHAVAANLTAADLRETAADSAGA